MPGLVGFTCADRQENPRQVLQKMQDLITHYDFYIKDELFCNGSIYSTRSHINIIQKKSQPFNKDGIYIWLDGEFYNRDEISIQQQTAVNDDPEILHTLFKQSRDFSFLKQIDGIFSAVIYDSIKQMVHLVTDRYGLRHLYWTVHKGCLAWGSEVKTMLALPGFEPKINRRAVEEFFGIGYLLEDRTWFEDVELLSSGTVLTWDIREQSAHKQRYWWWDEIKPLTGKIDEGEIAEELGRLFIDAVERRSGEGESVGLTLSGGLDSRAILASMPDRGYPIHAVTFGRKNCDDIRIAAMSAKVKGAIHHTVEINANNWLMPRLNGVWWTDGQLDLMHMHSIENLPTRKELFDINLSGFLPNGSYLKDPKFNEIEIINNRGRRFVILGPKFGEVYLEARLPFFDNKFMNLIIGIPGRLRAKSYIYKKMLLNTFPEFFRTIPYQNTNIPIGWPDTAIKAVQFSRRVKNRLLRKMSRFGFNYSSTSSYTDYPNWIRHESARSFFNEGLKNPAAIYPKYIPEEQVHGELEKHFSGENYADNLCRYLTFEIWLQQVFEGKYRNSL